MSFTVFEEWYDASGPFQCQKGDRFHRVRYRTMCNEVCLYPPDSNIRHWKVEAFYYLPSLSVPMKSLVYEVHLENVPFRPFPLLDSNGRSLMHYIAQFHWQNQSSGYHSVDHVTVSKRQRLEVND